MLTIIKHLHLFTSLKCFALEGEVEEVCCLEFILVEVAFHLEAVRFKSAIVVTCLVEVEYLLEVVEFHCLEEEECCYSSLVEEEFQIQVKEEGL